ncbi:MAG TPA: APC family permease, partial [Terriglobales bacterium]|nr:APC family permease [Terriglobales bacterium]
VIFVGAVALAGALLVSIGVFSFGLGAEMLNFGALIAFMGVNAAAFMRYFVREEKKKFWNFVPPVLGFFICLLLWLNLSRPAIIGGVIWMAVGIAFGAWKTRGFRGDLVDFELPPEEA